MSGHGFQVSMLAALLLYFVILIGMVRKKSLNLRYTLLWLFSGVLMLFLVLFPGVLNGFAALVGISMPTNALFAVVLFCLIIILVSMTSIVSRQNDRIRQLTQAVALLKKKVEDQTDTSS